MSTLKKKQDIDDSKMNDEGIDGVKQKKDHRNNVYNIFFMWEGLNLAWNILFFWMYNLNALRWLVISCYFTNTSIHLDVGKSQKSEVQ